MSMTDEFATLFEESSLKEAKATECGLTATWLVDILRQTNKEFQIWSNANTVSAVSEQRTDYQVQRLVFVSFLQVTTENIGER